MIFKKFMIFKTFIIKIIKMSRVLNNQIKRRFPTS